MVSGRPRERILKTRFILAYSKTGLMISGCRASRVSMFRAYRWLKEDTGFGQGISIFHHVAADTVELELHDRAVNGVERPIIYKGEVTGCVRDKTFSSDLLQFQLEGMRPGKFKQRFGSGEVAEQKEMMVSQLKRLGVTQEQTVDAQVRVLPNISEVEGLDKEGE